MSGHCCGGRCVVVSMIGTSWNTWGWVKWRDRQWLLTNLQPQPAIKPLIGVRQDAYLILIKIARRSMKYSKTELNNIVLSWNGSFEIRDWNNSELDKYIIDQPRVIDSRREFMIPSKNSKLIPARQPQGFLLSRRSVSREATWGRSHQSFYGSNFQPDWLIVVQRLDSD